MNRSVFIERMSKESANVVKPDSNFSKEREENRNLVQRARDNFKVPKDKTMDNLRVRKNKCWGDKDSKASVQRSQEDPGRSLVGAQDIVDLCNETQLLLNWSPDKKSPVNTVQKRCDTENEDPKHREQDLVDDDSAQRVKYGQWSMSEIKKNPESSQFLLKWPPEGSTLRPVPEKSGADSEDAENCEEDKQKRMLSKRRKRSMTEIHKNPEFAWFLPKWPPEGSTLGRSGGQGFTDHHEK